jgi:hypothetical protein
MLVAGTSSVPPRSSRPGAGERFRLVGLCGANAADVFAVVAR